MMLSVLFKALFLMVAAEPGIATFKSMVRLSGNLVGISINLCKSIQKELFINDTP